MPIPNNEDSSTVAHKAHASTVTANPIKSTVKKLKTYSKYVFIK